MKRAIVAIVTTVLCVLCFHVYAVNRSDVLIEMVKENNEPTSDPRPSKGHRMPTRPETCVVDFKSKMIQLSVSAEIVYYELWSDSGDSIVVTYVCDRDMVEYMCTLSGCYYLRLLTTDNTYIGYMEL